MQLRFHVKMKKIKKKQQKKHTSLASTQLNTTTQQLATQLEYRAHSRVTLYIDTGS